MSFNKLSASRSQEDLSSPSGHSHTAVNNLTSQLHPRALFKQTTGAPVTPPGAPSLATLQWVMNVQLNHIKHPPLTGMPPLDLGAPAVTESFTAQFSTTTLLQGQEDIIPSMSRASTVAPDPADELPAISQVSILNNVPLSPPPAYIEAIPLHAPIPRRVSFALPPPIIHLHRRPREGAPLSPVSSSNSSLEHYPPDVLDFAHFHSNEPDLDNISVDMGEVEDVADKGRVPPRVRRELTWDFTEEGMVCNVWARVLSPAPECMRLRLVKEDWKKEGERVGYWERVRGWVARRRVVRDIREVWWRRKKSRL